ncbi:hypothetical protein K432DRAFT_438512 [Lepidopterella palustris CBS 459.81]|uniref:C2H2-type domain-containing protein n=1 Tax=Lepidopterella palustris CBS 459.81 TaxID=1314670 RepID=A0A8E2EMC0_9PEZI|nr:hypothetical protein K432DRAFT_438512 [Lepidopterella palustris CBS 459.81]
MAYPNQPYNEQGGYGAQQQVTTWGGNYGANHETTSQAAEALRHLSNTAYATGDSAAVSNAGLTPTNAATSARYSNTVSQIQRNKPSYDAGMGSSSTHISYGQSQARLRSVNAVQSTRTHTTGQSSGLPSPAVAAGYPSQRTQAVYNQQRAASPKMQSSFAPSAQYNDYNRILPNATETSCISPATSAPTVHSYSDRNATAAAAQASTSNGVNGQYDQSTITVDPMQVYDPWPEYQRKQAALKAQKAAEDAARTEENWKVEEARRQEEETCRAAERKKAAEQKNAEDERGLLQAHVPVPIAATEKNSKSSNSAKSKAFRKSNTPEPAPSVSNDTTQGPGTGGGIDLETEMRAMMAKMRELNSKNPALLARIWGQESKSNGAGQSLTTNDQSTPQSIAENRPENGSKTASARSGKATSNQKQPKTANEKLPQHPNAVQQPQARAQSTARAVSKALAPPTTPQPVKQQGNTIWPPEKREQLATAASTWLNSISENRIRQISKDQILHMLDSNPSYIDLCEQLEKMGMKLERAAFARALLAAVPDVNSSSRQPGHTQAQPSARPTTQRAPLSHTHPNGGTSVQRTPEEPQKDGHSTQPGAKEDVAFQTGGSVVDSVPRPESTAPANGPLPQAPGAQTPYFGDSHSPLPENVRGGSRTPAPITQMMRSNSIQPPRSTPKPTSKEEAARKRNFSEVVDLTGYSDEELPPPQKKPQLDAYSHQILHGSVPTSAMESHAPSPQFGNFTYNQAATPQPPATSYTPPMPTANDIRFADVVQPIDKRKALRRSSYNIKTIARDVLIATGKHPEMRPLNAHLEVLKSSFNKVDNNSDLSTFRWDIVDPGDPPKRYLQRNFFAQENDADDEDDSGDDEAPPPARPRAAAQQAIAVGGGGAPITFSSTMPGNGLVKGPPKRRGRPPRNSLPMTSRPYGFAGGEDSNPRTSRPSDGTGDSDRGSSSRPRGFTHFQGTPSSTGSGSIPTITSSAPHPRQSGTGYSAFRLTHAEDGTPIPKKKGRPVGWRKAIHGSAEAQARIVNRRPAQSSGLRNVTTPSGSAAVIIQSGSPRIAAQPSSTGKTRVKRVAEPHYSVYKCHWKNCTAELHNLDTLRKHVHKLHGKPAAHGGYDCLWDGCGKEVTTVDKRTGMLFETHQYPEFSDDIKWRAHMELKHFGPLGWSLGDGPASGLSDAHDSEAYLSNTDGRRVTPQVTVPASRNIIGSTNSTGPASVGHEPARRGRPPKASQERAAQETERAMINKKREIGPGVDRGGARLATEKRRMGFNDDEDFDEEIVDKDD